jgi:hypothetical protein
MIEKFQTLEIRGCKSSNHWKFLLCLFPMLGSLAMAQGPGSLSQGGFFQAWWGESGVELMPPVMAGLIAWYDASDATTISVQAATNRVTQWADKSGSGFHLGDGGASANRPQFVSGFLGGKSVIQFNDNVLIASNNFGIVSNITIIALKNNVSSGLFPRIAVAENIWGIYQGASNPAWLGSGVDNIFGLVTSFTNVWEVITAIYDGNGIDGYLNTSFGGTIAKTGSLNAQGSTPFTVGNRTARDRDFNGYFAEVLIYNTSLSSNDLENTINYFDKKWSYK